MQESRDVVHFEVFRDKAEEVLSKASESSLQSISASKVNLQIAYKEFMYSKKFGKWDAWLKIAKKFLHNGDTFSIWN